MAQSPTVTERRTDEAAPRELDIVDTFTRLIFNGGETLSARDMAVVVALCQVDAGAEAASATDFPRDLGSYLRAQGVSEMIALVEQVRNHCLVRDPAPGQTQSPAWQGRPSQF